jgi:hypothetical protein
MSASGNTGGEVLARRQPGAAELVEPGSPHAEPRLCAGGIEAARMKGGQRLAEDVVGNAMFDLGFFIPRI